MTRRKNPEPEPKLIGHYAGPVTRLVSYAIDAFLVSALFSVVSAGLFWLIQLVTGENYDASDVGGLLGGIVFLVWIFLYFWGPIPRLSTSHATASAGYEGRTRSYSSASRPKPCSATSWTAIPPSSQAGPSSRSG